MTGTVRSPSPFWAQRYSALLATHPEGMFPAETILRAKQVLADTLAAMAAGAQLPEIVPLGRHMATSGGASTLVGCHGLTARPEDAAFFNAVSGTASEMDEGHYPAGGHPGIHTIAAALAAAEESGASGPQIIDAIILGYEAAARIGMCTRLKSSVHSHGTWGIVGAAAAVARLKGFEPEVMFKAMTIAAGLPTATSVTSPLAGANVRHIYAGAAARNGLLACFLAENGFDGEPNAVEIAFGDILGAFDGAADPREWGESWLIDSNYFKFAASCRDTHGSLAALDAAASGDINGVRYDQIESILVETFAGAVTLAKSRTGSTIAARFSIPFVLATQLVRGSTGVDDFGPEARSDPRIVELANRIKVVEDASFTRKAPRSYTRITIALTDGRQLTAELEGSLGDHDKPMDPGMLRQKFERLTHGAFRKAAEIEKRCLALEKEPDFAALTELLRA